MLKVAHSHFDLPFRVDAKPKKLCVPIAARRALDRTTHSWNDQPVGIRERTASSGSCVQKTVLSYAPLSNITVAAG